MSLSPERVINNLTNIRGQPRGQYLIDRIVSGPEDIGVIVVGEMRSGKSTIIGDIADEVERASSVPMTIDFLQHEHTLDATEIQLGRDSQRQQILHDAGISSEIYPRRLWGGEEYQIYSANFFKEILEQERRCVPIPGKRVVRIIEALGLKLLNGEDRGFSTLVSYYRLQGMRGYYNTLLEWIVQDPSALIRGNLTWQAVQTMDLRTIKEALLRPPCYLRIVGVGNSLEEAAFIQETIFRWAAPDRANDVHKQTSDAAHIWAVNHEDRVKAVRLPVTSRLGEAGRGIYREKAAHAEHTLRKEIGVPEDWGEILFNPCDPDKEVPLNLAPFWEARRRAA